MNEILKIILSIIVLFSGILIGNLLRNFTLDEQKSGRKWFFILTIISLIIGSFGLIFRIDWILFTFFFIAIVTSRSMIKVSK